MGPAVVMDLVMVDMGPAVVMDLVMVVMDLVVVMGLAVVMDLVVVMGLAVGVMDLVAAMDTVHLQEMAMMAIFLLRVIVGMMLLRLHSLLRLHPQLPPLPTRNLTVPMVQMINHINLSLLAGTSPPTPFLFLGG